MKSKTIYILHHTHGHRQEEGPLGVFLTERSARLARLRLIEERTPTGDPSKRAKWEHELQIRALDLDLAAEARDLIDPLRGLDVPRPW